MLSAWQSIGTLLLVKCARWRSTTCPSVPSAPRTVQTYFAQDHTSTEMVYANTDITEAEQAREIIAFADYWQVATGSELSTPNCRPVSHSVNNTRRSIVDGGEP